MPTAVAAAVAAVSSALSGVTLATVGAFIAKAAVSLVISSVLGSLFKPKLPNQSFDTRRTLTVRQPTAPRRVVYGRVRVGGTLLFATVKSGWLHTVIEWAGHECDAIEEIWLDDQVVTIDGSGNGNGGYLLVKHHLGTADQAAEAALIAAVPDEWTSAHRLRGRCYSYVAFRKNSTLYPSGMPNVSVVLRGKKVYDPRSTSTAWSANPALCVADWLTDTTYGLGAVYADEIDETALIAAANVCEESVTLAAGGTEDRYTCNGAIPADASHKKAIADLSSAMAGHIVWRHGQWVINAGAYDTPTVTLTEADFRGALSVKAGSSRKDLANAIKGLYVAEDNLWQPSDYPAVTNSTYRTQDGGETLWRELDLPFTTSAATAQRIAKIALERMRQQIVVSAPCRLSALRAIAGGTINLTYSRFGWDEKPFEVEAWQFVTYTHEGNPVLGVNLELREIAAEVFSWNSGEETTVDPAPDTNLPSPFTVGAPTAVDVESGSDHLVLLTDGTLLPRLFASWDEPDDFFTVDYEVQYRKLGEADWRNAARGLGETQVTFGPVVEGETYQVRVRSVGGLGTRSAWTQAADHVAVGKSEPPSAPETFTITQLPDGTRRFAWTHAAAPIDVRVGGGYEIRYYSGATTDWSAMTALNGGLLTASPWETNDVVAGTYTFAIKAIDSSGNYSADATFISATLGDPRLANVIYAQYEHEAGWPGTLSDCWLYNNKLIAISATDMTGLPATIGGLAATIAEMADGEDPIEYTTLEIDLGVDVAFTPLVTVVGTGTATVTMKTGTTGDGGVTGSWVSTAFVSSARYLQIKVSMSATNAEIRQIAILINSEAVTDTFEDINTATETATWFNSVATGHFQVGSSSGELAAVTSASISALQSVGAGWSWELVNKSSTVGGQPAAEFKIYDNTGTLADAVVDVYLRGPKNG